MPDPRSDSYSGKAALSALPPEWQDAGTRITGDEFSAFFQNFKKSSFRYETLPIYTVAGEDADFAAYKAGAHASLTKFHDWHNVIINAKKNGRPFQRVRVVPEPLTLYFCYEVDWYYIEHEKLGLETRFLAQSALPLELKKLLAADYWLFDDSFAGMIEYNNVGDVLSFIKIIDPARLAQLKQARDIALKCSISLSDFLKTYKSLRP